MASKFEQDGNPSEEAELIPLENGRRKIVDWLKGDPEEDPSKSLYIQVINQKIDFYNDIFLNLDKMKQLFAKRLVDTNLIPEDTELSRTNFYFHAVSYDYTDELIRTFPLPRFYLEISQRLMNIKEQDLERRRQRLSLLDSETPEYLIYDATDEAYQIKGNLHPGFIVGKFD